MRFLGTFLASCAALALLYVVALEIVNPHDEFRGHSFPPVFLDVRRDKMALFSQYNATRPVQGIVLGSSTSMTIPPDELSRQSKQRFFNFAVHAGKLEDYVAIFRWARATDPAIETVVLGLDQWALSVRPREEFFENNWALVSQIEPAWRTPIGRLRHTLRRYHQAFSVTYAKDMLTSIRLRLRPEIPIQVLHPDGGMHYERWNRQIAAGEYPRDEIIDQCIRDQLGSQVDSAISDERSRLLGTLFREAAADRIALFVYVSPIHPRVTDTPLGKRLRGGSLAAIQRLLPDLASQSGSTVLDFTTVTTYAGEPAHWYDCMHMGVDDSHRIADTVGTVIRSKASRGGPSGL